MMPNKRRIIVDNDGCDVFLCDGGSYEQFTALRFAGLAGTGATTVFYTPQSVGLNRFTHNTRVGTVITDGETVFERNIAPELIARGTDCFEYAIRFCREHKLEIFFGMRMNDTHDAGRHYDLNHNALKREHPECLLGTRENRPRHGAWTALNTYASRCGIWLFACWRRPAKTTIWMACTWIFSAIPCFSRAPPMANMPRGRRSRR